MRLEITTVLEPRGPAGAIILDDAQVAEIGGGAKVFPVKVTVNGTPVPLRLARMGGENMIGFRKEVRKQLGVEIGDELHAIIERDDGPREVAIPEELQQALDANPEAKAGLREARSIAPQGARPLGRRRQATGDAPETSRGRFACCHGGMSSKTRAVQVAGPGEKLELVERDLREPGRGEVRVRVEACGVCHSDAITVEGWMPVEYPRVPGHEIAGVIEAVGEDVIPWDAFRDCCLRHQGVPEAAAPREPVRAYTDHVAQDFVCMRAELSCPHCPNTALLESTRRWAAPR